MKTILPVLLFLIISYHVNATIRTATGNTGQGWSVASNWSASGVPQNGDTVLIPAGATMTVKSNIYSTSPNLVIRVYGTLYFAPGGKLDLGSTSSINIYSTGFITSTGSPSSVITIGNVNKYSGNSDGTIVGPAYASSASGASPIGFGQGTLPVKFQSFFVKSNTKKQALLSWIVSDEYQIANYSIEKSNDGRNWKLMNKQIAKNTNQLQNSYADIDSFMLTGNNYYRILATGFNGELFYSTIEMIAERNKKILTAYPNPAASFTMISSDKAITESVTLHIYNTTGVLVQQQVIINPGNKFRVGLENLKQGSYILKINKGNELIEVIKIQKN